jgi:O-antigen/teichoic acid export membrane protein
MVQKARGNEIARLDVKARADLRRESFDAWQALVLIGLAVRAPIFLSLALLGPAATAILEIALRFGTLPTIVTSAVSMTFAPTMASQHAKHDREGLADTLALSSWLAFVPAACTLLVVSLLGHWLLATFLPPEYEYAYLPLLLVIASTTIHGAFGMSHTLLFMTGHQRVVRYFSVLQLAAVVALGFVLALILGVNGIALALLFSSVVFDVGLARQLQPLLNVTGILRPEGLRTLWHTLKGAPLPAGREELH